MRTDASTAEQRWALADTSLFVAVEQRRPVSDLPPVAVAVSVITVAELRLGVLAAGDVNTRSERLDTLRRAESFEPLSIDGDVAVAWARLQLALRDAGRRLPINDSWIAATAIANGIPVITQNGDYDGVPELEVLRA